MIFFLNVSQIQFPHLDTDKITEMGLN